MQNALAKRRQRRRRPFKPAVPLIFKVLTTLVQILYPLAHRIQKRRAARALREKR